MLQEFTQPKFFKITGLVDEGNPEQRWAIQAELTRMAQANEQISFRLRRNSRRNR